MDTNELEPCPRRIHPTVIVQTARMLSRAVAIFAAAAVPCAIAAMHVSVPIGKIINHRAFHTGVSRDSSSFKLRSVSASVVVIIPLIPSKSICCMRNGISRILRSRSTWRIGWRALRPPQQSVSDCFVVSFARRASPGRRMSSRSMLHGRRIKRAIASRK